MVERRKARGNVPKGVGEKQVRTYCFSADTTPVMITTSALSGIPPLLHVLATSIAIGMEIHPPCVLNMSPSVKGFPTNTIPLESPNV